MIKKDYIFYCDGCSEKDAKRFCKEHDIELATQNLDGREVPLIFIDPKGSPRDDLQAVTQKARGGVVVVVRQLSDFGTGAQSRKVQDAIRATGAEILVPERNLQKRGPKLKGKIPDEHMVWAKFLHDNPANSRQFVCDKIFQKTGVKLTRHQLKKRFEK